MSDEKQKAKAGEAHTLANTTVKNPIPGTSPVTGQFNPDDGTPFMRMFLGTKKSDYDRFSKLIELWLTANMTAEDRNATKAEIAAAKSNLEEFARAEFPAKDAKEINRLAQSYYNFFQDFVEPEMFKNAIVKHEGWTNQSEFADGRVNADIIRLIAGRAQEAKFSMRDRMRRQHRRASSEPENIRILLRNSFVCIRISRPDVLDLSRLIQNINAEIRGYVRRVNGNSLTLARASIIRVIWNFIADRIVWCSVKDTQNYYELANVILRSDIGALAMALIASTSSNGINLMLEHQTKDCDWSEYDRVDPTLLVNAIPDYLTSAQAVALGNLENHVQTYSREEVVKLQAQSDFQVERRVYFPDGGGYFELKDPTLATVFETFDLFVARVRPSIQDLRASQIDDAKYAQGLDNIINTVGGSEYVHWIDKYVVTPEEGSDEEPVVYTRADDSMEFTEGLFDILNDDAELSVALVRAVRNNAPRMSHTMVGVPNFVCPNCKGNSGEENSVHGITPFDPLMAFFIHTQLTLMERIDRQAQGSAEALSN